MAIKILVMIDHYAPGYKAGGPLRTIQNMVQQLGGELAFRVVTRDRDDGDARAYDALPTGRWTPAGKGEVIYLSPRMLGIRALRGVIAAAEHDVLYLNSLFSPRFAFVPLVLRRLGAIPRRPLVLAPRGELHPGALAVGTWPRWVPAPVARAFPPPKQAKKRAYLAACRALGLLRDVIWQASSPEEAAHIRAHQGPAARVLVAPDLVDVPRDRDADPSQKRPGALRVAFLSRIDPKKNLDVAISLLAGLRGEIVFDVYGPVSDAAYWERCRAAMRRLPGNVTAAYHGPLPPAQVGAMLRRYDLLLLPTRGENFGHVIAEALLHGCPVLTSDRTPWRHLERRGVGWDLPLERPDLMLRALERCVEMDAAEHGAWSRRAASFARRRGTKAGLVESNRRLFLHAMPPAGRARRAPSVPSGSRS